MKRKEKRDVKNDRLTPFLQNLNNLKSLFFLTYLCFDFGGVERLIENVSLGHSFIFLILSVF